MSSDKPQPAPAQKPAPAQQPAPAQLPATRATQLTDPARIAAFVRRIVRAERGLGHEAADRLAERIARRIKRVVVWDEDRPSAERPASASPATADVAQPAPVIAPPRELPGKPDHAGNADRAGQPDPQSKPEPAAASAAFDPFAFSVVVVLTKTGKDGLMKRLAAIDRAENLKKLAEAQHLAVDPALSALPELRAAIVKAAETRIANRRAAAS